jgi:glycosyltransferase involved in cell wall biosynthesis
MKVSLLISTYNWESALNLCLKSVLNQSVAPDEIIISDDGSTNETKRIIEYYRTITEIPIVHVWHEDKGFRLAKIRNKSIEMAQYNYIVQIDGDIILHKNYIKDQKKFAKKDTFLSGSRVLLLSEITNNSLQNKTITFNPFSRNIKNRFNAIYFPFVNYFIKPKSDPIEKLIFKVRGCNMSFWKKDLLEVNGYDESFTSWGREDSEIAYRLIKKGVNLKKIRLAAIQYHLYHNEPNKNNLEANNIILEKNKMNNDYRCKNGIIKD